MKRKLIAFACIATIGLGASGIKASASQNSSVTSGSIAITNTTDNLRATVNVGGGKWDYGSTLTVTLKKKTHSNYFHETRAHASTARVGSGTPNDSGRTKKSEWSRASATGNRDSTGYANWRYED